MGITCTFAYFISSATLEPSIQGTNCDAFVGLCPGGVLTL